MTEALPPICVLAGGLGSRLGEQARRRPKALLEVAGEPFILHQLRLLAAHGAQQILICVGYLGEQIVACVGNDQFGLTISYSHDGPHPLGTLGAIRRAAPLLGERFLVLYGDTYLRIDYLAAARAWAASGLPALMTVLCNEGQWDTSNATFDGTRVVEYEKRAPAANLQWIDYGLGGLTTTALATASPEATDLADLYHVLARRAQLFGFEATERFYEIGTSSALAETSEFLSRQAQLGLP